MKRLNRKGMEFEIPGVFVGAMLAAIVIIVFLSIFSGYLSWHLSERPLRGTKASFKLLNNVIESAEPNGQEYQVPLFIKPGLVLLSFNPDQSFVLEESWFNEVIYRPRECAPDKACLVMCDVGWDTDKKSCEGYGLKEIKMFENVIFNGGNREFIMIFGENQFYVNRGTNNVAVVKTRSGEYDVVNIVDT